MDLQTHMFLVVHSYFLVHVSSSHDMYNCYFFIFCVWFIAIILHLDLWSLLLLAFCQSNYVLVLTLLKMYIILWRMSYSTSSSLMFLQILLLTPSGGQKN